MQFGPQDGMCRTGGIAKIGRIAVKLMQHKLDVFGVIFGWVMQSFAALCQFRHADGCSVQFGGGRVLPY